MSRIWALKTPRFAAYWFQSFVMSLDRRKRWYFHRFISSHDTHPLNWIHPRQMPTFLLSADKSIQVWKGNKCLPNQYFAIHPWNYENYKIKPKQKEKKRKQRSKLKKMSNKKEKKRHWISTVFDFEPGRSWINRSFLAIDRQESYVSR